MVGDVYEGMTIAADQGIAASWSHCSLGGVRVASVRSQKALVDRWGGTRRPGSGPEELHVIVQTLGHVVVSRQGQSAVLANGDLTFFPVRDPYQIAVSDRNESLVIDCPMERLAFPPDNRVAFAERVDGAAPAVGMLRDFLRSLLRQKWPEDPDPEDMNILGEVLLRLLVRCFNVQRSDPEAASAGTRERVISFVMKHLTDSGLRTGMIARALSLSPRTVQDVFAAMATTPTAFILSNRLSAAAEVLERGDDFGNLTDLAFDLGFNDSAYFARRFKRRFGVSPGRYRRRLGLD